MVSKEWIWEFGGGKEMAVEFPIGEEDGEAEEENEEEEKVLVACEVVIPKVDGMVVLAVAIVIRASRLPVVASLLEAVDDLVELVTVTAATIGMEVMDVFDDVIEPDPVTSATVGIEVSVLERVVCGSLPLELSSVVVDTSTLAEMEAVPENVTEAMDSVVGTVPEIVTAAVESTEITVPDVTRLNIAESVAEETAMAFDPNVAESVGEETGTALDTAGSTFSEGFCIPPSAHHSTFPLTTLSPFPFPKTTAAPKISKNKLTQTTPAQPPSPANPTFITGFPCPSNLTQPSPSVSTCSTSTLSTRVLP